MWTTENRGRYDRSKLRYPSDLTDEEWALIEPLIPPAKQRRQQADGRCARGGQRRDVHPEHRLPVALDPEGPAAAQHGARLFRPLGLTTARCDRIHHALYVQCRELAGREASPTAGDHRQPERQERGKRGACIDPSGL